VCHDSAQVYLAAPPAYAGRFIAIDRSSAASQKASKCQSKMVIHKVTHSNPEKR
jgi:hypothetical protein